MKKEQKIFALAVIVLLLSVFAFFYWSIYIEGHGSITGVLVESDYDKGVTYPLLLGDTHTEGDYTEITLEDITVDGVKLLGIKNGTYRFDNYRKCIKDCVIGYRYKFYYQVEEQEINDLNGELVETAYLWKVERIR